MLCAPFHLGDRMDMKISKEEAWAFAKEQLIGNKEYKLAKGASHYGKLEISELLDTIYGCEEPGAYASMKPERIILKMHNEPEGSFGD